MKETLLVMYMLFFVLLMVTIYIEKFSRYYLICKSFTSLTFVMLSYLTMKEEFFWLWFLAFVFCFLGDVFLGMNAKKKYFIWGLSSFVIGHLLFIFHMSIFVSFQLHDFLIPICASLFIYFLVQRPKFHVGRHQSAILIYAFIITLLCVKGYDMWIMDQHYLSIFYGCLLFFISDSLLLFIYFYEDKLKIMRFFNLLAYYGAVGLLACSTFI